MCVYVCHVACVYVCMYMWGCIEVVYVHVSVCVRVVCACMHVCMSYVYAFTLYISVTGLRTLGHK